MLDGVALLMQMMRHKIELSNEVAGRGMPAASLGDFQFTIFNYVQYTTEP